MTQAVPRDPRIPAGREWLLAIVIGCCLSSFVWRGLLLGGGLVGGDTYPYFFPQKQILADAFSRWEVPLWHDRTSLGYPLLAESQAGIFYPTNQILYRFFDINTAYNIAILLHYSAAFICAWRFSRSQGLSDASSLLAAMVFVYGWFPVRVSLEWSIIGGVWFPASLWMTERLLQKPTYQRWTGLAMCLAVHMLAGHFTLAFITQLTCVAFAILTPDPRLPAIGSSGPPENGSRGLNRWRGAMLVIASIAVAMLMASVQLLPTLELRQLSQRDGSHAVFNPSDGHMPPMYLTQLVASWWYWHTPEMAASRESLKHPFLLSAGDTNPVEAHLYIGMIPLLLLFSMSSSKVRRRLRKSHWKAWSMLSIAGVLYAFGWFVPFFRHLPGFGFFIGPGRYTIITTMGFAIVAGLALDALLSGKRPATRVVLTLLIGVITLPDLLKSAEFPVCNAQVVAYPPLNALNESWIARTLQAVDAKSPVRLLAGGPNVGNLFGISSVPLYLGLGPADYFSETAKVATQPEPAEAVFPSAEQMQRLHELAVSHILTTDPVQTLSPACELVASGPDAFLNRVWGRGNADCYLYRLREPKPRISTIPSDALTNMIIRHRHPTDIEFEIVLNQHADVGVCELMFPGWEVQIDSNPVEPNSQSGIGRFVSVTSGTHIVRWVYRPGSFGTGCTTAILTLLSLGLGFLVASRRRW